MNVNSFGIYVGNILFYFLAISLIIFSPYLLTTEQTSIKADVALQKKEQETLEKKVTTAVTGNENAFIRLLNLFLLYWLSWDKRKT